MEPAQALLGGQELSINPSGTQAAGGGDKRFTGNGPSSAGLSGRRGLPTRDGNRKRCVTLVSCQKALPTFRVLSHRDRQWCKVVVLIALPPVTSVLELTVTGREAGSHRWCGPLIALGSVCVP